MTPVITDPERFDVEITSTVEECRRLRLFSSEQHTVIGVENGYIQSYASFILDREQLTWLRDRFNEILGEVKP